LGSRSVYWGPESKFANELLAIASYEKKPLATRQIKALIYQQAEQRARPTTSSRTSQNSQIAMNNENASVDRQ
jgi:hypothetical protein